MVLLKKCSKCETEMPATQEFFYLYSGCARNPCRRCVIKLALARREADPDKWRENGRKAAARRRSRDPERYRATTRKWWAQTRDARAKVQMTTYKRRRQEGFARLNDAVKNRIGQMVRKNGESKSIYLPFTSAALKEHLERQFLRGMSWDNFGKGPGKWHVDHIVPLSSFKFDSMDDSEFRAAWALTNLRPLWGPDNQVKGAKRVHLL